jgi:hypothetical protein
MLVWWLFCPKFLLKEHGATTIAPSPLLVIFHQIFELRDLISTFSKKDFIQRDLIAPNLPDSKAKTQNHQKLYGPCLPWQGLLYLNSL